MQFPNASHLQETPPYFSPGNMSGGASFWGGNGVGFPNSIDMANVQAPVQEVLLVLTKASHACAGSLEKLDLKVDRQTSKEFIWGMLEEFLQSREDKENRRNHNEGNIAASATELKLQSAVITSLEDKLHDSHVQISRMNEIMQHQSAAITDLNRRLETVMAEVQDVAQRPPPSDAHLLAHLDKQMNRHRADVDKRLASQAEREAVEHLSQARVEELLRSLSNQVADLRMEVDRKATKEQFHALSDGKVDSKEHLELLATVHEKISMTQLTSSVNNQVRPLVMAMAALEKAVVIQDVTIKRAGGASSLSVQDHMDRKMGPAWDAAKSASDGASDGASRALDVHKITDLVESILKSYRIGEVTQIGLEKALAQQHDSLLREVGAAVDNVRSEVVGVNRERMAGLQRHLEDRLSEAFRAVDTSRQKIQQQTQQREQSEQQTLACIRELAGSTTKALQKKADMSDLKSEIKKLTSMVDERTEAILASEHSRVAELDAFFDASDRTPQRGVKAESSPIRPVRLAAPAPAPSSARGSRIPAWTPRKSQALEAIGALEHMDREAEKLRKSLADFKTRAEKAEVEAAALKTALELKTVALSAVEARRHPASHYASPAGASPPSSSSSSNAVNTEWRLALGELGASLRRELDNKMNRGDFQGMLSPDILRLDGAVKVRLCHLHPHPHPHPPVIFIDSYLPRPPPCITHSALQPLHNHSVTTP